MISMILGALIASMIHATHSFEECKKADFKPKACVTAKATNAVDKIGK